MKRVLMLLPALAMAGLLTAQIQTPAPSPLGKVEQKVGLTEITIEYSRPGVKDRTIFAEDGLVPLGEIWRTGANAATTIEFSEDVMFGDVEVAKGKYAVYTIPGSEEWSIMLYSDLTLGGNVSAYDEEKEVARVTVKSSEMPFSVETLTMGVGTIRDESASFYILWDKSYVEVALKVHTDKQVRDQIEVFAKNPMSQISSNYLNAGWYLYNQNEDLETAADYMKKGVEYTNSPFAYFWMNRSAEVLHAAGDKEGALKMAQKGLEAGMNAPDNARGFFENTVKGQLEEKIEKWSM